MNVEFQTPEESAIKKANEDNFKVFKQQVEYITQLIAEEKSPADKANLINAMNGMLLQAITGIKAFRLLNSMSND